MLSRERYSALLYDRGPREPWPPKTDVEQVARETDILVAETKRLRAAKPFGRRAVAPARRDPNWSYCLADLRASQQGREVGRRFAHDSFRAAAALGLRVDRIPLAELQRADRPGVTILGRLWGLPGQAPFVQLANELDGRQALETVAHEIAHFLNLSDERLCDQFAAAFMKVEDDELRGAVWRALAGR